MCMHTGDRLLHGWMVGDVRADQLTRVTVQLVVRYAGLRLTYCLFEERSHVAAVYFTPCLQYFM